MKTWARRDWIQHKPVYNSEGLVTGYERVEHQNDVYLAQDTLSDASKDALGEEEASRRTSPQFAFVSDGEATRQIVDAMVKTQRGELQLDTTLGVPYMETAFRNKRLLPLWVKGVQDTIQRCPFVRDIASFDYDVKGDSLSFTARVTTVYSTTEKVNG